MAECVRLHQILMLGTVCLTARPPMQEQVKAYRYVCDNINELKGKNLACWCRLDKPCHADTLLLIARGI
jgi:hypothetical protein